MGYTFFAKQPEVVTCQEDSIMVRRHTDRYTH